MKKHKVLIIVFLLMVFVKLLAAIGTEDTKPASLSTTKLISSEDSIEKIKPVVITTSPIIDFDAYVKLANEVQRIRKNRLVSLDTFMSWGKAENVIILDTRSDSLYNAKHIKGAIHLNFADFTQDALNQLIPDTNTKILIYCNNNFKDVDPIGRFREPDFYVGKGVRPVIKEIKLDWKFTPVKPITLALNIPTFINLIGYGYPNVYELAEQLYVRDPRLKFEGTAVAE